MKRPSRWLAVAAYATSASAHAWLLTTPPRFEPRPAERVAESQVSFVVAEPKPILPAEPAPPPPLPAPPPPTPQPKEASPAPAEAEPAPAASDEPPPPSAAPQPELTGTTLVADGVGAFSAELGSGAARSGPVVAGVSRPMPQAVAPAPALVPPAPSGPPVEALKDLLKRPSPPDLGAALERNYPKTARAQGKSGEAKVRARVDPDGVIRVTKLVSESAAGFGSSCERTLQRSRWSAPINRRGQPVATWISYRCHFTVDD